MQKQEVTLSNHGYVEYRPGSLKVILSVPHGGCKRPSSIPDRDAGYISPVTGNVVYNHKPGAKKDPVNCPVKFKKDEHTMDLANQIANELHEITGKWPHMVICNLYRGKMDANADMEEACFGIPEVVEAWKAYHDFVQHAKESFNGPGLFLDIHGHIHKEEWVELGYLITGRQLDEKQFTSSDSSIKALSDRICQTESEFVNLLSGPNSFGALLEEQKFKTVPSPTFPCPNRGKYFSGRYNITRHGSLNGGVVDAIQIETPRYLRNKENSHQYAQALAKCIDSYIQCYYSSP